MVRVDNTDPLAINGALVDTRPFWHIVQDDWLDPDLYSGVAEAFPTCPPASGPTGYTMFWGDPAYDNLIERHPGWRDLFRRFHSQAFVDQVINLLQPVIERECRFDLSKARYVPFLETRDEKQRLWLRHADRPADDLWVRLDIMQGRLGYGRSAHLDHRRRLASLLLYMSDGDETGMAGGDLVLHGESGDRVVRARHNRMVLFPCHRASRHSVTRILAQSAPRNFVQVTVSSCQDLWKPGPPVWQRAAYALGF
jgi:hypothetical protein